MSMTATELIERHCKRTGLPDPVREYGFARPVREWQFDLAWPEFLIAVEIEGGIWSGGRHTSPTGFLGDMAKYNEAAARGWRVLRFRADKTGAAELGLIERVLRPACRARKVPACST